MLEERLKRDDYTGDVVGLTNNATVDNQIDNEKKKIKELQKEYDELNAILEDNKAKGYTVENSEAMAEQEEKLRNIILEEEQGNTRILELQKQKFDNIRSAYETQLSYLERTSNVINEQINQIEKRGYIVSKDVYQTLLSEQENTNKKLKDERDKLIAQTNKDIDTGNIEKGSKEWYERQQAIDDVSMSLEQGKTQVIEYANAIRDVDWKIFDLIRDRVEDTISESEFMIDLLSNRKLFEDNGEYTKQGLATLGSRVADYNMYMAQADSYHEEMLKINKQLADDPANQTLLERRNALLKSQQQAIKNAEDEKEAIKSLVKDGYDKQIDSLKKLVDAYKDSMKAEKDLYDYSKSIKESTKNISSLQKQLVALQGDNSEEGRAKRQKLEVQIEEERQDLADKQYDKYIDDQSDLLDKMLDEYESIFNKKLEDTDTIIKDAVDATNTNADSIESTLKTEAENVGYTFTNGLDTIWDTDGKASKVAEVYMSPISTSIDELKNSLTGEGGTIAGAVTTIKTYFDSLELAVNGLPIGISEKISTLIPTAEGTPKESVTPQTPKTPDTPKTNGNKSELSSLQSLLQQYKNAQSEANYYSKINNLPKMKQAMNNMNAILKQAGVSSVSELIKKIEELENKDKKTTTYSQSFKKASKYSESFKKAATGVRRVPKDDVYWTQELGQEYIVRPSDGAILTPLKAGDAVLNNIATDNIWKAGNDPMGYVKDALLGTDLASISSNNTGNYVQNFENITFSMPNVKNYEQLIEQMQSDKGFEKLILSMSVDRLAGGSAFGKYKALR